jgi:signal transduction histidine kinase
MEQTIQLLELMDRPAFLALDGQIIAANAAALARQIVVGAQIADLLACGKEEYAEFQSGCLCLDLELCGQHCPVTVSVVGILHLFTLEPEDTENDLRMLSLAAQQLREPLSDVMALVENLPSDLLELPGISRGLHRLLRIVGNMTPHPTLRLEMADINALLREIWDQAQSACESRGIRFTFSPHPAPVYSCADTGLLTRAIHNLLSNAMKAAPGGSIHLQLTTHRQFYRITMHDTGSPQPGQIRDPFSRFLREPGLDTPEQGLGLGMRLVRSAAFAHGGTVLMDSPKEGGIRVSMTIPVQQNIATLRSPRLQVSYCGELDPLLIELSDVLPPEFYKV